MIALFVPLSSLRAKELGQGDDEAFWFAFFMLVQFAISGYFFLREWWDYGTASANLKHHDLAKRDSQQARAEAFAVHTEVVAEFMSRAEDLTFLYRQAPRWDSYIVQSYLATVHYFRHLVVLTNPTLDVFITHATVPYLGTEHSGVLEGEGTELDPVSREHLELRGSDSLSRGWWLEQVNAALVDSVGTRGTGDTTGDLADEEAEIRRPWSFESPARLLSEFLERYFGLTHPYVRPEVLDHIELVDEDIEPAPPVSDDEGPEPPQSDDAPMSQRDVLSLARDDKAGADRSDRRGEG